MALNISNVIAFFIGSFCGAIGILFFSIYRRKHNTKHKDETVFTAPSLEKLTKEEQEKVIKLVDKVVGR